MARAIRAKHPTLRRRKRPKLSEESKGRPIGAVDVLEKWMHNAAREAGPFRLKDLFEPSGLEGVAWEKFRDGIEIHRLYAVEDGTSAALLRYAPGAQLQRHVHTGYEHILVLSGSQIDDAGRHLTGTLLVYEPGTSHTVRSEEGCVVLVTWERPVVFIGSVVQ